MDHIAAAGRPQRNAGFTISELVLVLGVTAILVVVIIVSVRGIHDSTNTSTCQTQVRDLRVATNRYLAETQRYPKSKVELIRAKLLASDDAPDYVLTPRDGDEGPELTAIGRCA